MYTYINTKPSTRCQPHGPFYSNPHLLCTHLLSKMSKMKTTSATRSGASRYVRNVDTTTTGIPGMVVVVCHPFVPIVRVVSMSFSVVEDHVEGAAAMLRTSGATKVVRRPLLML